MSEEKKKKNITVSIQELQAHGVDLHEFIPGETYPLSKLMDTLGLMKSGRSKLKKKRDKN